MLRLNSHNWMAKSEERFNKRISGSGRMGKFSVLLDTFVRKTLTFYFPLQQVMLTKMVHVQSHMCVLLLCKGRPAEIRKCIWLVKEPEWVNNLLWNTYKSENQECTWSLKTLIKPWNIVILCIFIQTNNQDKRWHLCFHIWKLELLW